MQAGHGNNSSIMGEAVARRKGKYNQQLAWDHIIVHTIRFLIFIGHNILIPSITFFVFYPLVLGPVITPTKT